MVEAAVALGIIVTAVSSALTLVTVSVKAEKESELGIVAANLVREGVEAVRAIRDSNWLAGNGFDVGLIDPTSCAAIPVFDPAAQATGFWSLDFSVPGFGSASSRVWRYVSSPDPATLGLYVQASSKPPDTEPSVFRRMLTVSSVCVDEFGVETAVCGTCPGTSHKIGLKVESAVRWNMAAKERNLKLEEWLYDWR